MKRRFLHMRKPKSEADQHRNTVKTIHLLPKFEISSLFPSSVAEQPGLCSTWAETPKNDFLMTRLNYGKTRVYRVAQFFPFFLNHRLWILVRTEAVLRWISRVPMSYDLCKNQ